MEALISLNSALAGFFAFAAIHSAIFWWLSRKERVLLAFSVQCAVYAVFSILLTSYFRATTIPGMQAASGRNVSLGMIAHALVLHFYGVLGERRDRAFRALLTGVIVILALINLWAPVRGTIVSITAMHLPGGGTGWAPVRTPPGASLVLMYLAEGAVQFYGFFVARLIWKRDRPGAALVAVGSAAALGGVLVAVLIDFARWRAPYLGASPHAVFVVCVALFLAREYSARGTELRAHRERLEELVATRTVELLVAKDDAEHANQAKSRFLAHMSHETRNPLHAIRITTQVLQRDRALGEAQRQQIQIIDRSARHLLALIDEVLEMSKLEVREPELIEQPFDPWSTLDEVAGMFAAEAESKSIALEVECGPELPRALLGDGAKVRQVLINLASNALKFTQRGSIRFKASSDVCADGAILVKIVAADTGIGIAAADTARMFQPFEQLDAGKRAGGSGLGLAISRGYARRMGGDLTVESIPNIGSTFTFTFMAKSVRPEVASETRRALAHPVAGPIRRKVLIVDDLAVNRDALSALLSAQDLETRTAANGPGAISISTDWHPDVVLIDLRMPDMDGFEVIQRMRAAGSRAAIGALTASVVNDDERHALAAGADFFLRKPFEHCELVDRIAQVRGAV